MGFYREAFGPIARRAADAAFCGAALGLCWHFDLLPCPGAALFGVPCPGCGLSRAASLLLHGDLQGALLLHPLSPVLVPLVLAAATRAAFEHVRGAAPAVHTGRAARGLRRSQRLLSWLLVGLVLVVWAARFLGAFGGPVQVISAWGS